MFKKLNKVCGIESKSSPLYKIDQVDCGGMSAHKAI